MDLRACAWTAAFRCSRPREEGGGVDASDVKLSAAAAAGAQTTRQAANGYLLVLHISFLCCQTRPTTCQLPSRYAQCSLPRHCIPISLSFFLRHVGHRHAVHVSPGLEGRGGRLTHQHSNAADAFADPLALRWGCGRRGWMDGWVREVRWRYEGLPGVVMEEGW